MIRSDETTMLIDAMVTTMMRSDEMTMLIDVWTATMTLTELMTAKTLFDVAMMMTMVPVMCIVEDVLPHV